MAETALTPYKAIEAKMVENKTRMADLVPNSMEFESTFNGVLLHIAQDKKLQQCSVSSIVMSAMAMFELGLDCVKVKGHAYLVPFWNKHTKRMECQLIPGYRGLIDIAKRSGVVTNIMSYPVYEQDIFDIEYGTNPFIEHKPFVLGDAGPLIGAYAVAHFREGIPQFEFMNIDQLNAIKERSKSRTKSGQLVGPWVKDEIEMHRKTPIRRLFKYLPSSESINRVIEIDNKNYESIDDIDDSDHIPQHDIPLADRVTDIADQYEYADYEDVEQEKETEKTGGEKPSFVPLDDNDFKPKLQF